MGAWNYESTRCCGRVMLILSRLLYFAKERELVLYVIVPVCANYYLFSSPVLLHLWCSFNVNDCVSFDFVQGHTYMLYSIL